MDTNIYSEGAIYYYNNCTNTKSDYEDPTINHDFVVSRPVYIIDSNELPFENCNVNCCIITSSVNRVGIPINISGIRNGKILPYYIYSLNKDNLTRYMGHVNPDIKEEVRQALAYHMGFDKNTPKYITDYEEINKKKKKFLDNLTDQERTVYDFLKSSCAFREIYYVEASEIFDAYMKHSKGNGYKRQCDFSRCLSRMKIAFPNVGNTGNRYHKIYTGVSLKSNIKRQEVQSVKVISNKDEKETDINEMTKEELIGKLDINVRKVYNKMDILQKYQNYRRSIEKISVGIKLTQTNGRIIKRLIDNDVDDVFAKIKKQMKSGMSPFNLSHPNMYILYQLSDTELKECINSKYRKKGIAKLRKSLKQEALYVFNNM